MAVDVFYDRGRTFPPTCFLDHGVPEPKIVGMPILFSETTFLYTWAMGLSIGMQFDFSEVSFRMRYGAP